MAILKDKLDEFKPTKEELVERGLSGREANEFRAKLRKIRKI